MMLDEEVGLMKKQESGYIVYIKEKFHSLMINYEISTIFKYINF